MDMSLLNIQHYFEERMAKFELDLQSKSSSRTGSLEEEFKAFKYFILITMKSFSQQLQTVAHQVDNMEMRGRRKILLLHGVEEHKNEETAQVVVHLVKQLLKLEYFCTADTKRCHRMGHQQSNKKPRPILVKLYNVSLRDIVWFAETKLKGAGITMSEFLTRARHTAFMAARERFGVDTCWTREGSIFVLGADGQRHQILSLSDLDRMKGVEPEKPAVKSVAAKSRRAAASAKK